MITIRAAEHIRLGALALVFLFVTIFTLAFISAPAFAAPQSGGATSQEAADLMKRIDDCQTAINEANAAIKEADREYEKAKKSAEKAQQQINEQEQLIAGYRELLEQLSVEMYKGQRAENPLLELLDAETFEELDSTLDSIDAIAAEEMELIEKARKARKKLENAKRSYDAQCEKARAEKKAAQEARAEAKSQRVKLIEEAAKITKEIADDEARRSLASAIAEQAFPEGSTLINPCPKATKSSDFGYRDFDKSFHQGLDLAAAEGTPYYAAAPGTVIYATNDGKDNGGAGNWVVIAHGGGVVTKYMHSKRTLVQVGDVVKQGQHIGDVGETGAAYGAHLHFQVEVDGTAVDPEKAIKGKLT